MILKGHEAQNNEVNIIRTLFIMKKLRIGKIIKKLKRYYLN